MRARGWMLGLAVFCGLATSASAQFSQIAGTNTTGTSAPAFFTSPFAKPDFSAASVKPTVPGPLNLMSMMPSWSSLQSTIMGRSSQATAPVTMTMQRQQAPPPSAASSTTGRSWLGFGGAGRGPNPGGFRQYPGGYGQYQGGYGARPSYSGFFP